MIKNYSMWYYKEDIAQILIRLNNSYLKDF